MGTVPSDNPTKIGPGGVRVSTRKGRIKNVKGVEPTGRNKEIWNLKRDMKKMFEMGKLERGAVPPIPEMANIKGEAISTSTATRMPVPISNIPPKNGTLRERCERGTIPPNLEREHPSTATRGTIPPNPEREPPSTAMRNKWLRKFPPGERSATADNCQTDKILRMENQESHGNGRKRIESVQSKSTSLQHHDNLEILNFTSKLVPKNSRKVEKEENSPKINASKVKNIKQFWENKGRENLKSTSRPKLCLTNEGVAVPPRNCVGQLP